MSTAGAPLVAPASPRVRLLTNWADVTRRDQALTRLLIDLEDLMDATGAEVDAGWFDWAKSMASDIRAHLVGKGVVL